MKTEQKQVIDDATLTRISEISRMKLSEGERGELRRDLNGILGYFSLINEIEAAGEELYYIKAVESRPRPDKPIACEEAGAIRTQFAKKKESGEMLAPKSL